MQQIDQLCTIRPSTVKDDDELDDEEDEDKEDDDDDIYDGVQWIDAPEWGCGEAAAGCTPVMPRKWALNGHHRDDNEEAIILLKIKAQD